MYFYLLKIREFLSVTFDYQFIDAPAFNEDRGPVSIFGFRVHIEL